jgi:hypothetical protein
MAASLPAAGTARDVRSWGARASAPVSAPTGRNARRWAPTRGRRPLAARQRQPGRHVAQQGPGRRHVPPIQRLERARHEGTYALTYTPTLRGRSRPVRSVRHRRKSAISRVLSFAVRACPGVSGRRPHLQVPSTPPSPYENAISIPAADSSFEYCS